MFNYLDDFEFWFAGLLFLGLFFGGRAVVKKIRGRNDFGPYDYDEPYGGTDEVSAAPAPRRPVVTDSTARPYSTEPGPRPYGDHGYGSSEEPYGTGAPSIGRFPRTEDRTDEELPVVRRRDPRPAPTPLTRVPAPAAPRSVTVVDQLLATEAVTNGTVAYEDGVTGQVYLYLRARSGGAVDTSVTITWKNWQKRTRVQFAPGEVVALIFDKNSAHAATVTVATGRNVHRLASTERPGSDVRAIDVRGDWKKIAS